MMESEGVARRIGTNEFGLFQGVSYNNYCNIDALRHSDAKSFSRSPLHARYDMLHPSEGTTATVLGTALHVAVLEPENLGNIYAIAPKVDKRTKEGKLTWMQFEADNKGAILLRAEEYEAVKGMAEAVHAHPFIEAIIGKTSLREATIVWDESGVSCKCRIDWAVKLDSDTFVVDLKSTADASTDEFARSINRFKYHAQAASYLRGLQAIAPAKRQRRWLWVAVENTPPHGIAIYEPGEGLLEQGEQEYLGWVQQYRVAVNTNNWPGYPVQLQPIDLPKWAWRNERTEVAS